MQTKYCKHCGCEIPARANFCDKCGRPTEQLGIMPKMMRCKACGHMVSKSAESCPNCGQKTPGQQVGEAVKSIGCSLLAAPIIIFLIILYVVIFEVLK